MPRPRWIDPVAMQIRRVGATGEEEVASGECGVMSQDGEEKADSFRQGRGRRDDSGGGARGCRPQRVIAQRVRQGHSTQRTKASAAEDKSKMAR